ncbi:disease resistance protein SUMM2-like isoform X2 [Rhododendron vialii]|uniref:disease resistance protein SUMM2-like isoform X2 n=1 Tax=Rhododendron vialii TaxID=182163 RepID=UPI00265E72BD|nr:disease resistance protein SUMM2-like isoform X2 [Rhododendron vialii]XP_058199779.1 disease resistance protein SUMM2-like isoform X2 [Rhododendron vialii]
MAEAFAVCTQSVCDIGKCLWACIATRINYARKLSKNRKVLCEKAHDLSLKRKDIFVEIERSNPQKIATNECDDWIGKVQEMENKVGTIQPELNEEKRCVVGLCLDIFARIKLGKRVVNMINDINKLLDKSKFERGFLVDAPVAPVENQPDPPSTLAESANCILDMLLDKIQHKSTLKIGIWGMGGVGKTTVLRLLNNTPEIARIFDFVIWVTVSKSQSIRMIQEEVGQRLSVEITKGESDDRVAIKLHQRLNGKKYLLLLDDVWKMVDLDAVGLPNANQNNGCKVVLTTRKLEVCRKMGTDIEIKVDVLPKEEARKMFYANVGDLVGLPAIKQLAESIVTECDGLPLALKVVSGALRKEENVKVWENFLRELRSPATSFIEDLNEKVFNILKVSYDQLQDTQKKQCLLFCGLYPEDSKIEKSKLIGYWRAEGILSRELTLHEAHVKGHAILQALIDSSLLEKCDRDDRVKMHDIIRDLVLAMTSPKGEEPQHLVRAGISSEKIPNAVEWEKATRISFIDHDLCNLPESPDCPELLTLLLQGNDRLRVIPETFFNNMPNLKVLDLSRTGIKSLPTSIAKLESLRELVLSECESLKALPAGVICRLSQIEVFELHKCRSGTSWRSDGSTEIVAKELSALSSLSSLRFDFQSVGNLQHFLESSRSWKEGRLTQFWFFVGDCSLSISPLTLFSLREYNTCLFYEGGGEDRSSGLSSAIQDVLRRSNCFGLRGHEKLNTFLEVGAHDMYELRCCVIEECVALQEIVNRNGLEMGAFPNLEVLGLVDLPKLKTILCLEMEEGALLPPLPPNANIFTNLKHLSLEKCPLIKQVFSSGFMVQQLSNLEGLYVSNCGGLEGMIPEDEVVEHEALPKLRTLGLQVLPEFVSIFKGVPMRWQSLEKVRIRKCPKLRKLPFDSNSAPNLKKILGDGNYQEWWDALEWDNDATKLQFQPFLVEYL